MMDGDGEYDEYDGDGFDDAYAELINGLDAAELGTLTPNK